MRKVIVILLAIYGFLTIFSCANRGIGPQGGPKDTTPPAVTKYSPADGCTNMKKSHIEITFDEIVTLDNPYQKVIVSPPQKTPAEVKAIGQKVVINFVDSLLDSTTYTIDFTDAIQDNNESNKLKNFSYCFSTGDFIDTLRISGKVIEAENHNPVANIMVGIQSNLEDSAFTTLPFRRITKTDENGHFTIKNIAAGSYHLFALDDIGSNYFFDMPNEKIAFLDTILMPTCKTEIHNDTVYAPKDSLNTDSLVIDTIITHSKHIYEPKNVLLKSFVEQDIRQYLVKSERKERYRMDMYFNIAVDTLPDLRPVNFADSLFNTQVSLSNNRDSLTYWFRDTALWSIDTLLFEYRHDTVTDTLQFLYRAPKQTARKPGGNASDNKSGKKKKPANDSKDNADSEEKKQSVTRLAVTSNASKTFDIYQPLQFTFAMPTTMNELNGVSYHLEIRKDTLWQPIKAGKIRQVDSIGTKYTFSHEWIADTAYRFVMDSSLFTNMIGHVSSKENIELRIKPLEEYSKLILHLKNIKGNEVIQLIDKEEKVVREMKVNGENLIFEYITPGVYYMRLFRDEDGDGKWSTGKYSEHRQPEEVLYFPFDIELRAFWDVEEDWDPEAMPLLQQKPRELVKTSDKK